MTNYRRTIYIDYPERNITEKVRNCQTITRIFILMEYSPELISKKYPESANPCAGVVSVCHNRAGLGFKIPLWQHSVGSSPTSGSATPNDTPCQVATGLVVLHNC
jgi:hypothetical protein